MNEWSEYRSKEQFPRREPRVVKSETHPIRGSVMVIGELYNEYQEARQALKMSSASKHLRQRVLELHIKCFYRLGWYKAPDPTPL